LGGAGERVSDKEYLGVAMPPERFHGLLADRLVEQWLLDGKPKTIVRLPPAARGSSDPVTPLVAERFRAAGARVLDATGTGRDKQAAFLAALEAERDRDCAGSQYDVVLGIMRVMEGTDWPHCSSVYCVGMPGSLETVIQLLGRALRKKPENYPTEHRDRARIVFFVPGAGSLEAMSLQHSRHALLTACFLANNEIGQSLLTSRAIRAGFARTLSRQDQGEVDDLASAVSGLGREQEALATYYLMLASDSEQPGAVVDRAWELVQRSGEELTRDDLAVTFVQLQAGRDDETGARVRERLEQVAGERARQFRSASLPGIADLVLDEARSEIFRQLEQEFRAETLDTSETLGCVGRQLHTLTGGKMRELADRLLNTMKPPFTEEQIFQWVVEYRDRQLASRGTA
jgi:hypothetical protein